MNGDSRNVLGGRSISAASLTCSPTLTELLGVLNIAGALPASVAPAIAPVVLAMGGGYALL